MLKRFPFHPILFSAYPVLALLAYNLQEVEAAAALRSLRLALAGGMALFLLLWLLQASPLADLPQVRFKPPGVIRPHNLRKVELIWQRAGLACSFALVLFFAYGHLYGLLEGVSLLGFALGRHRFLAAAFLALLAVGWWWIAGRLKDVATATGIMNAVGIALLVFPLFTIARFSFTSARADAELARRKSAPSPQAGLPALAALQPPPGQLLPDIYYIILDTYTRGDALRDDLGYDNSPFLDGLRQAGFYVAGCSRSNYSYTLGSLTSALNMDYLPVLAESLKASGLEQHVWALLKHSQVRSQLEAAGYKTVAFETGYEWSRLSDADIYLGRAQQSYAMQTITPFEAMLVKSTLLLPLIESRTQALATHFNDVNFPYSDHINRQLFILDQLPQIAFHPEPTFTFVHILMPHIPYVFAADGQIQTDPGFYSGKRSEPVNDDYRRRGYTEEIQFLNKRLLDIVHKILETSRTPSAGAQSAPGAFSAPIIILQGDHGLRKDNRYLILNAYHVSEAARSMLYPSITPVNSFRVIFNAYFGTDDPLLPDTSFSNDPVPHAIEETRGECVQ